MNKLTAILMLSLVILTGCAKQTIYVSDKVSDYDKTINNSFFLSGIGQSDSMNVSKVCNGKDNVVMVESRMSGGQVTAAIFTLGIYTPRKMKVYCSSAE